MEKTMKYGVLSLLSLVIMVMSFPAFALDLQEARAAGLVGETPSGYVEAVVNRPDVQALVNEVNAKRKQEYARISQANGQSVDVVAKLAAEQVMNRLSPGSYYKDGSGTWKQR